MTDPTFDLFHDWDGVLAANEMCWSYEALVEYAKKTYDPEHVALAVSGSAGFRFHRFMTGDMLLATRQGIESLDARSVFAVSTHFANKRDPERGGVYPEDEYDVRQAARLMARIGWENVATASTTFYTFFYEDCRANVEMYLNAGVSGRFICHVPVAHPGGEAFDVEEALFLEENGVPPEYAAGFSNVVGDENLTDIILKMWRENIPLEYATA